MNSCAVGIRVQLEESPSWEQMKAQLTRKGNRLDKAITILLDLTRTRYILTVDCAKHHQVSDTFCCTDVFLNAYLVAVVHPTTKGATERVIAFLGAQSGH